MVGTVWLRDTPAPQRLDHSIPSHAFVVVNPQDKHDCQVLLRDLATCGTISSEDLQVFTHAIWNTSRDCDLIPFMLRFCLLWFRSSPSSPLLRGK